MPAYRAYKVGIDGHFIGSDPLVCEDDNEAIVAAKGLVDGHDVELLVLRAHHHSATESIKWRSLILSRALTVPSARCG
jgi:hypothetical protein